MNTANKLTMVRVILIPFFMVLLYIDQIYWALAVFVLASFTDWLDGYVARRYNQITDFGKFMDPLADKLLVTAAMVWFVEVGMMASWILLLVITREFAVTGLRLVAAPKGRVIAAGNAGKVKTAATMAAICLMLLPVPQLVLDLCVWAILATTLYSGIEYFWLNRDVFREEAA